MDLIQSFDGLLAACAPIPPLTVAVVGATDVSVLEGVCEAVDAGLIAPTLVGPADEVAAAVAQVPQCEAFPVIPTRTEEETCTTGVQLVLDQTVKGVVKGQVHTSTFMRPVLGRLRTERRVSHVFLIELPTYHKLLSVTDAAVNIGPDLTTKAAIVNNAIGLARTLGIDVPKVAALSSIETINPAIPSTIDAACLAKMADRGQIHGALVDGPLAFDGAISAESARIKGIRSPVSGEVDIVLVPDIDSGNILVKDLEYLANATIAGIVLGAAAPVVLTSRADPPRSRLLSCALAAYVAHHEART
jgi:phosphotransacetylase